MARNKLEDLRDHLFATLEALRDKDDPMDLDRAKAVKRVADSLIDSAKVEVEYLKVTGQPRGTNFLPPPEGRQELGSASKGKLLNGSN